jgi:hypothetical protein
MVLSTAHCSVHDAHMTCVVQHIESSLPPKTLKYKLQGMCHASCQFSTATQGWDDSSDALQTSLSHVCHIGCDTRSQPAACWCHLLELKLDTNDHWTQTTTGKAARANLLLTGFRTLNPKPGSGRAHACTTGMCC